MKIPIGFRFAGTHAGIKQFKKDLALVVSDAPASAAGCFTVNRARAAPVADAATRLPGQGFRAILVNSGNANALTGPHGDEDVRAVTAACAAALELPAEQVLTASTGVIGQRLPVHKIVAALPELCARLSAQPEPAAEAILTTDTRIKTASRQIRLGDRTVTLSAIAKGSGMVAPQLATVIAVILTDCDICPPALDRALREAVGSTFNCLVVDGDMSTNDAVVALANGLAGNPPITDPGEALAAFTAALSDLCAELSRMVAADGEGATRLLEVRIGAAPSLEVARDLARSIAASPLVKAALFGADPNWGRILATVGARAGSQGHPIDPAQATVRIQGVEVYGGGAPRRHAAPALKAKMRAPEVIVDVDLAAGEAHAVGWGCDLSYDYVKINADYAALLSEAPDGGVARDNRLTHYTPAFKVSLLVEALSYISRFSGKRCVIKVGGQALTRDALKKSFCQDVNLLRTAGLRPIVVHGGGPEVSELLAELGQRSELQEGIRVVDRHELPVLEMVLTGKVAGELVTLLNQDGAQAFGLSGKDGGLLRARRANGPGGRDVGQLGEITRVNPEVLEVLLDRGYVPIVSPIALGDDGQSYHVHGDWVAAELAAAVKATKLIFLGDEPGLMDQGELVSEVRAEELEEQLRAGRHAGGAAQARLRAALRALGGGVERVHLVDGRTPHGTIAELFTDRGVGTLILP